MDLSVLQPATKVLHAAAFLAAWPLAVSRRSYRPIAIFLGCMLAAVAVRWTLLHFVLATAPRPRVGWSRVAFHADQALFLAWPFSVLALAVVVFLKRSIRGVALAWAASVIAVASAYPWLRQARLGYAYAVLHLGAVIVALGCTIAWMRRPLTIQAEHRAGAVLVTMSLTAALGADGSPFTLWPLAQGVYCGMYVILVVLSGRDLWKQRSSSPASPYSSPSADLLH